MNEKDLKKMDDSCFARVILYARQHRFNKNINESLEKLIFFLRQQNYEVYLDKDTAETFKPITPVLPRSEIGNKQDLIIVVGGDGSLLAAARIAVELGVSVVGLNRGRLGFLTDISPQNLEEELTEILTKNYYCEKRFLLNASICSDSTKYFEGKALNDVVLSRGRETHLIEFEVYVDAQLVSSYRSDGMIIATPTGSTAYALSAGGPIMHPNLDAIVLVPMFSHSLSSRALVISSNSNIELKISSKNDRKLQVSCDGLESREVHPGQKILVNKYPKLLNLLHPKSYHYYDTLRQKLGWES